MDLKLSEFIAKTSCEPGFAQDLLNHHEWNLAAALKTFYQMKNMIVEKESDSFENFDCILNKTKNSGNFEFSDIIKINGVSNKDTFLVSNKCTSEPSLSSQSSDACDSSNISSPTKLTFKSRKNDIFTEKKLSRGISRASDNENLISKARFEVAQDFKTSSRGSRLLNLDKLLETPDFTFILPDINAHEDEEFSEFLKRDLIEKSTLSTLQCSKRLNWWSQICHNLYPLVTSGDGNCLLHAASLGMWGFHDRELILRKALHTLLSNSSYTRAFYRRWRWQTHFQNSKAGLNFSESEWEKEWQNVVRIASTEPRSKNYGDSLIMETAGGKKDQDDYEEKTYIYESLEEIHIFVLAHVLQRPIIVIADTMLKDSKGEAFYPILFGGIYLPLECPDDCLKKSPLCLTFESAHFSALVAMNVDKNPVELPLAIPLTDFDHNILPLHFAIDPGEVFMQENMTESSNETNYMDDLAKTFVLTEQDKIELLKKYFDLLTLAHKKENCIEKDVVSAPKIIEKSQTLPSDFGRKNDFSYDLSEKSKTKTLISKATAKQLLQKPLHSFGRMGKCIKKNLGQLARRSTSFRNAKTSKDDVAKPNTTENRNGSEYLVVNNETNETANYKESIINTDNSIFYCDTNVLAAKLYTNKKHFYYEEMIKNYLTTAWIRFLNEKQQKKHKEEMAAKSSIASLESNTNNNQSSSSSSSSSSSLSSANSAKLSSNGSIAINHLECVNSGCKSSANVSTNYLCSSCFDEQKQVLLTNGYGHKNDDSDQDKEIKTIMEESDPKLDDNSESMKSSMMAKNPIESNGMINGEKTVDEEIDETKKKLKEINFNNRTDFCITNM